MAYITCPYCRKPGATKFLWMVRCPHEGCAKFSSRVFSPGRNGIVVEYTNYANEHKQFYGEATTIVRKGAHLGVRLAPTGQRCWLRRERIGNLGAVESRMPAAAG